MTSPDRMVQLGDFDRRDRAEAAAAFLAGDDIEAVMVGEEPPFRLAVPVEQVDQASALLGLAPATTSGTLPDELDLGDDDPWDQPLPESSIWHRPPWMKLAVVVIVVGMLLPAIAGLLRLYPG
jgi:hypothetical protein